MRAQELLTSTPSGVYCEPGGFHIDPPAPVARALITHGHSDHARAGHGAARATAETLHLMRRRRGEGYAQSTKAVTYGETVRIAGDAVTFPPAGHVLRSPQIAIDGPGLR